MLLLKHQAKSLYRLPPSNQRPDRTPRSKLTSVPSSSSSKTTGNTNGRVRLQQCKERQYGLHAFQTQLRLLPTRLLQRRPRSRSRSKAADEPADNLRNFMTTCRKNLQHGFDIANPFPPDLWGYVHGFGYWSIWCWHELAMYGKSFPPDLWGYVGFDYQPAWLAHYTSQGEQSWTHWRYGKSLSGKPLSAGPYEVSSIDLAIS